jgi:hypothetical protein
MEVTLNGRNLIKAYGCYLINLHDRRPISSPITKNIDQRNYANNIFEIKLSLSYQLADSIRSREDDLTIYSRARKNAFFYLIKE